MAWLSCPVSIGPAIFSDMYRILRPFLFQLEPERAHRLTLGLLRLVGALPPLSALMRRALVVRAARPVDAFGLTFPNPLGLAAGYDKDGQALRGLACLGFGHIEVGTVTPQPQGGNPRPRLFRLSQDLALINRLGFPSRGAEFVARQLALGRPAGPVIGVNLGINAGTPIEKASYDYLLLMKRFASLADYLVINVSSPNTIGLRRLQARRALDDLLAALAQEREAHAVRLSRRVPLLVKLSPDLSDDELDDALDVIQGRGLDGVIACNTTIDRAGISSPLASQKGGLSGAPLAARGAAMVRKIQRRTGGALPIIAVGGIFSAEDARIRLDAGASLVQLYTGLVYQGPVLVKKILNRL